MRPVAARPSLLAVLALLAGLHTACGPVTFETKGLESQLEGSGNQDSGAGGGGGGGGGITCTADAGVAGLSTMSGMGASPQNLTTNNSLMQDFQAPETFRMRRVEVVIHGITGAASITVSVMSGGAQVTSGSVNLFGGETGQTFGIALTSHVEFAGGTTYQLIFSTTAGAGLSLRRFASETLPGFFLYTDSDPSPLGTVFSPMNGPRGDDLAFAIYKCTN
jgi:hypothetical protein